MTDYSNSYTAHLERERERLDQEACRLRSGTATLDLECWQEHLEQERRRLERENQSLMETLYLARTHCYQTRGKWEQYESWVSSPGDMYWYNRKTGEKVWDDWSPVEGEPDWWTWDQTYYELTQYFRTHNPERMEEVESLLEVWCDDVDGLWEYLEINGCDTEDNWYLDEDEDEDEEEEEEDDGDEDDDSPQPWVGDWDESVAAEESEDGDVAVDLVAEASTHLASGGEDVVDSQDEGSVYDAYDEMMESDNW